MISIWVSVVQFRLLRWAGPLFLPAFLKVAKDWGRPAVLGASSGLSSIVGSPLPCFHLNTSSKRVGKFHQCLSTITMVWDP